MPDTMTFWRGNRLDAEFTRDIQAVAIEFWASGGYSQDWPLERSLRNFLTDPEGFNASWDDETAFGRLLDEVRSLWPETATSAIDSRSGPMVYQRPEECGTVGCKSTATHTLTYSFPESRETIETDRVCQSCGEGYCRRPTLKASLAEGINQSTIGSQEEKGGRSCIR